ncbi:mCG115015 [Mus musculus]|nr:mCG115015 [Mus musculus]
MDKVTCQHGKAVEKSRQKKRGEEPTLTWEGQEWWLSG